MPSLLPPTRSTGRRTEVHIARVQKFPNSSGVSASSSSSSAPISYDVVDPDHLRQLVALGGMDMDCFKRCAGAVASLPDDPLAEILSRVPAKSVCRFKCVSKAWRGLIADPLHRKKLPQTLEGFFFDSDRCGDDSVSKDGDGEDSSNDGGGGSGDNWPRLYGHFVAVRTSGSCTTAMASSSLAAPAIRTPQ